MSESGPTAEELAKVGGSVQVVRPAQSQSTAPTQSNTHVSYQVGVPAGHAEVGQPEEQKVPGETSATTADPVLLQLLRESVETQRQLAVQLADQQRQIAELTRRSHKAGVSHPRLSLSPSYITSTPAGEYSASAALPLPPVVLQLPRKQDPRRASYGQPAPAFTPAAPAQVQLLTPAAVRTSQAAVQMGSLDEDGEGSEPNTPSLVEDRPAAARAAATAVAAAEEADDGMPIYDKRMDKVRKSMTHVIKPFHGELNKDTYNVIDWVEKLDTEFSIHMGARQDGRLDIVRSLLAGTALKWMNRRVQELNEQVSRGELVGTVEWSTLRQTFIDAHLGINTVDTFKDKLRALRLGSKLCPTPVELNKQFDHLAELAYPDRRGDAMAAVLGDEYNDIIAASGYTFYERVVRAHTPSTIEEWKKGVAKSWASERKLDATRAQLPAKPTSQAGQPHRGRGGYRGGEGQAPKAAGMSTERGAGQEGEDDTASEGSSEQLSVAAGNSQRSGRGGRGGRGRGGAAPRTASSAGEGEFTGICWSCNQPGHRKADCPVRAEKEQQSNDKAGQ